MELPTDTRNMKYILIILLFLSLPAFGQWKLPIKIGVGVSPYATWSTTNKSNNITISGGGLKYTCNTTNFGMGIATIGKNSGKWYWEITVNTKVGASETIGMCSFIPIPSNAQFPGTTGTTSFAVRLASGSQCVRYNSSFSGAGCSGGYTVGDVIGMAFDADAGTCGIYKNGVLQYTFTSMTTGVTWYPASISNGTTNDACTANFGASAFAYSVPSGYNPGLYTP